MTQVLVIAKEPVAGRVKTRLGPLRFTALLAPHGRDYGPGPNDFQVNKTAASVGVAAAETGPNWRLTLVGARQVLLSRQDLLAMPLHTYRLPIACVEGPGSSRPASCSVSCCGSSEP